MVSAYWETARVFKAFCDENRLQILKMLRSGEKCACKLLEELQISQSTLSHHMKILCGCGLVKARRQGKWTHYSLCCETLREFQAFVAALECCKGGDCQ